MQALFTSRDGGLGLQARVCAALAEAGAAARNGRADLQIMCFAFTDPRIAAEIVALARANSGLLIRILADWSQGAPRSAAMLEAMRREGLANLFLKVKLDMPYRWDPDAGRMRYSYGASRGMLHHKTLCLSVEGRPRLLLLGSYNWSARGRQAYENLLVLPATKDLAPVMAAFTAEFEALWSDHRLTAAPGRAQAVAARLRAEAATGRDLTDAGLLADVFGLASDALPAPRAGRTMVEGRCIAAFSGRPLITGPDLTGGHASANDRRALNLLRPSGARRPAPLTLNTLALEAIRSVPDGGRLAVAMYALSPRVPEFGALIAAARRGVRVQVLLDGRIGPQAARALQGFAAREGVPLAWRLTGRRMHQKYLCSPDAAMVLTGTANMTEDAVTRHSDHRVLFRDAPGLAAAFQTDFEEIWRRLPDPA
jgi:hypothetical protein